MEGFAYHDGELWCDSVAVASVAAEVGTPLYLYSAAVLRERYQAIASAFAAIDTTVCFSVKSCSNIGILNVLRQEGCSFDVVSGGELFRVIKAGGDPRKVVYAGVGKTVEEIRYALEQQILMFNVESEEELRRIHAVAVSMNTVAPVALRLNPDVDPKTHRHTTTGKKENKFGLDFERAGQLAAEANDLAGVCLKGIHLHLGSPINSVEPYREALTKALDWLELNAAACAGIEYINTGGGFGLLYSNEQVPPFSAYADAIIPLVRKAGKKLIIEPGRSIAGNAAVMLAQVQYVKSNGEKTFVIVDAGMNDLIRPAFYESYHHIWPVCSNIDPRTDALGNDLVASDIVGPICESSDCFAKDRPLPTVKGDDLLAMFSAGAYGFTMASTYNSHPRAAEVLIDGRDWKVIRTRESWDDLVALESV